MKISLPFIKVIVIMIFAGFTALVFLAGTRFTPIMEASSGGPPASRTGAPGETTCTACHSANTPTGQFNISAPVGYTPGQTYTIQVSHTTTDTSRASWGFELTSLTGANAAAGTFTNTTANTRIRTATNGRNFIEQTAAGVFSGQTGGSSWSFTWTAPATDVGPVTFYAAGLQADDDQGTGGDQTYTRSVTVPATPVVAIRHAFADFDGDGKADYAIYRPTTGVWYVLNQTRQVGISAWGQGADVPSPADFDGDGKTDISVYRPSQGVWYALRSTGGVSIAQWGASTDVLVTADYDGDGKSDIAVYRPSTGLWLTLRSSDTTIGIAAWGLAGDKPVVGDYDGDGKADIAQYRPSDGNWYVLKSTGGVGITHWGSSTDITVPGDYDGDGKTDVGVYRPSTGAWYIIRSTGGVLSTMLGEVGDLPVPADYDGDSKDDPAVYHPANGQWSVSRSSDSIVSTSFWGSTGDIPIQLASAH